MLTELLNEMEKHNSPFERAIRQLDTPVCSVFSDGGRVNPVSFDLAGDELSSSNGTDVRDRFPRIVTQSGNKIIYASGVLKNPAKGKRVGVLFSGGPAAGGHNVIVGLRRILGADNTLLGVRDGPGGLCEGKIFEITLDQLGAIFNTGGFDFLGTDRTKIKTDEQFEAVIGVCREHRLDGIVVIGGDDSNTNAAVMAEYLFDQGVQVIGVPKTIDGDLQVGNLLPISFGFDTATKVYAEMTGNVLQDTPSSRKYWHFIKVMGRAASQVALEVALQTKPAVCLISEEVAERQMSLTQVVEIIAQTVVKRASKGTNHGCVIIPEGLIEFVPEVKSLIADLNEAIVKHGDEMASLTVNQKRSFIVRRISAEHAQLFASFPEYITEMLLLERDSHGNLQMSQIPTERLLIDLVEIRVVELDKNVKFQTQSHFLGYEGRCGAPTVFDASYTYNLGLIAGSLILSDKTGYMAALSDLDKGGKVLALPLTGLLTLERRHGRDEFVIEKALVKTDSPAFLYYASRRAAWGAEDLFASPGPRQMWGPTAYQLPISVALNQGYENLAFVV